MPEEDRFRVVYCATRRAGAFGETIARFRRSPGLVEGLEAIDDGQPLEAELEGGVLPEEWRYGRTLAYVYLDTGKGGSYEHLFNEDLITLGLARTTTLSHVYRREFERLRGEAEARGAGLWSACPRTEM